RSSVSGTGSARTPYEANAPCQSDSSAELASSNATCPLRWGAIARRYPGAGQIPVNPFTRRRRFHYPCSPLTTPSPMRTLIPLLVTAALAAPAALAAGDSADTPLTSLPYTPGLDVSAMDRGADACVDFYQYACGGWMKANPIPPDQSQWDVYRKLAQDNQRFLWGILAG